MNKINEELINKIKDLKRQLKLRLSKEENSEYFQNEEKDKRANELILANKEKEKRAGELIIANKEKKKRADELILANSELDFQNEEKEKRADELVIANKELAFQNEEKGKRADELILANSELDFQNEEKEKRADELVIANKELAFQNEEKGKRADELAIANKELTFQNEEKDKRANELILANQEKEKRADELAIANKELTFQNEEKDKRANELILANKEKEKRADELATANKELDFQNEEKGKRADELAIANKELTFQNKEKGKRADELAIANKELAFQNEEKGKRADELAIANKELAFQNEEKEKRAEELVLANTELAFQNEEKGKRADELAIANKELTFQNEEKEKRANELVLANKELAYQMELENYRSEMERVALDLMRLIKTANAPIFGIDSKGLVNEWNQTSEKITGFAKDEVLGKDLVQTYITEDYKESVKKVLDDALLGKETANYEFPLFAKDGTRVMVLLNSSTRRDVNGEITGVLGVGQDITELAKNRTETESIAKELRQFIETANAPIFGIDNQGLVNEWNQTSEDITGFTKNEVLGKDLVQTYITEDYQEAVKKVLDNALLGTETTNYEFPLFAKDGTRVMVLLNSSTRRNANGKITGVLGVGQDITQIDKLRTASESIAKELRQFIETANAPIFGIDNQGLVNEWNQTSEDITGFTKGEVLGKDLVQTYITEGYQEAVKKVLDNALLGIETANYEFPLFAKDGTRVMVLLNSSTRRDANGKITGVLGVGQDITQIDKLRTASESIAKELIQFIDTANAPIFGIDNQGLVNEWNQTSEDITGFTKNEVLGKDLVQTYITEDYQEAVKKVLDNALLGTETANYEFPLFAKDGTRVMVLLNSSTRRDANGKITGVLGVGQDITQIDTLRTASESIAKELRQFIETANAPIFGIDNQGLVNEWNQTSEDITGFTKNEVLGKDLVQTYITEDYQEAVKKVLDNALLGEETANFEFPLFTKDKKPLMVLLNSSTRRNANGEVTGVLGVGQDITELVGYRKKLELKVNQRTLKLNEALKKEKELNELKSKFVSTASHEFRTPLSAINFAAGSIKKYWTKMEPTMIEKKLNKIEDQVMHMKKLLDDVLIVGQAEAGKIMYNPVYVNLGDFINEIIEEVDNSYNKLHKILLIDTEELKSSTIFIDEKLGRNIFINIISNAVKFSPNADKVTIEFSSEKNYTVISVTDFGIGIPKSELTNIFNPFTRGENVDLIQGTGLGLSIVKGAIDVLGGKIIVNSTIGNGTSFTVKIPKTKIDLINRKRTIS
jgi:PAS domain S-box-containing protein